MYFHGLKKVNLLIILFISINVESQVFIPSEDNDKSMGIDTTETSADTYYLPNTSKTDLDKDPSNAQSVNIPNYKGNEFSKPTFKETVLGLGDSIVPGKGLTKSEFVKIKNKRIFDKIYNQSTSIFSFTYIKDQYLVDDGANTFVRTFEMGEDSKKSGSLHFGFDNFLNQGIFKFAYGVNLGFGFNTGKAFFITGEQSEVTIKLWTLPLDISGTIEMGLGKWMKLALTGGPSLMGLYQSRDDKKSGEKYKHRRQVGYGYFAGAKAKISLGNWFTSNAFDLFRDFDVTNFFLNIEGRHQNYSNFQDDITISGTSFGVGFSFEYL